MKPEPDRMLTQLHCWHLRIAGMMAAESYSPVRQGPSPRNAHSIQEKTREVANNDSGTLHDGYGSLAKRTRTHLSSQYFRRGQEAQRRRRLLWLDGTSSCAGSATSRRSHSQASVSFAVYRLNSCFVQRRYSRLGCFLWAEPRAFLRSSVLAFVLQFVRAMRLTQCSQ